MMVPFIRWFRIDRIFVNLPMAELRDFQCHSLTVGTIGDLSIPSDHISVRLVIECPRKKHPTTPSSGVG